MYTQIRHVDRKPKKFSKVLPKVMVAFAVIFILLGILFESGYFLPAFCLAALYYFYTAFTNTGYDYTFEQETFSIDVIKGKRRRKTEHVLYYKNLEVIAPPNHEAVAKYKKSGGTEKIKKYDYTSYEDDIPYYTVIVTKNDVKIKILMDLDEEILRHIKLRYPQKVFLQ